MSRPAFDLTNLLLGLAWLGELDRLQIQRLWFPERSESTVEKTLGQCAKDGLLTKRTWSLHDPQTHRTIPQLARWSLTPSAHAQIKHLDQYPIAPAKVRAKKLLEHDARTTEAIVRLIELARPGDLSGIYVALEQRLAPNAK